MELPVPEKRYGYVRVSSKSQESNSSIETQERLLIEKKVPKTNIRIEIKSAADSILDRPIFQKLVEEELQEGDILVVTKMDRCSRNTIEFLKLQESLDRRKIFLYCMDLPYSEDPATNRLIATTLSSIAEFENNRRKDRQKEGIIKAKKEGKYKGRKSVINKILIDKIRNYKDVKKLSVTEIARIVGISRTTVYKVLKEHLDYVWHRKLIDKNVYSNID